MHTINIMTATSSRDTIYQLQRQHHVAKHSRSYIMSLFFPVGAGRDLDTASVLFAVSRRQSCYLPVTKSITFTRFLPPSYVHTRRPTCLFCVWRDSPQWAMASSFTRFLDHTTTHHST